MSKGSKRRPPTISEAELEEKWDRIFANERSREANDSYKLALLRMIATECEAEFESGE